MLNRISFIGITAVLLFITAGGYLCNGGGTPQFQITAIDCPVENIVLTVTATKAGSTDRWTVTVNVNVKCNGVNIPNAEIKVTYLGVDYKTTTNATGDASSRIGPLHAPQAGNTGNVTVIGTGGNEKTAPFTVQ